MGTDEFIVSAAEILLEQVWPVLKHIHQSQKIQDFSDFT